MTRAHPKATSKNDVLAFFAAQKKTVLTFLGYSGAGYELPDEMLVEAGKVLDRFNPATTTVNIGATTDGIGAVYALAKARGFVTTGDRLDGSTGGQCRDLSCGRSPVLHRRHDLGRLSRRQRNPVADVGNQQPPAKAGGLQYDS